MDSKKPRRLSVDNWQTELVSRISHAKNVLSELWDEMALTEEQQQERLQDSKRLVYELLDNMIAHEQNQLKDVKKKVSLFRQEYDNLRKELCMDPVSESELPKGLAPCGTWLKKELKNLAKQKEDRMAVQLVVYNEAKEACDRVGWDLVAGENIKTHIAPPTRLMEWRKQKVEADNVYKERLNKIKDLQSQVRKTVDHIGRKEFTSQDLILVDMDYDKFDAILSEEIVDSFVQLQKDAEQRFQAWFEGVQFEYDELMVQLHDLWELCVVSESERYFPKNFNPELQTYGDLENVRKELARLQLRYAEGKEIYDKLREWLQLWQEKVEFEEDHTNSKEKYNNRGGALQQRLKREAHVKAMVPKVLLELEHLCAEYARSHENLPPVGPGGMPACEYAKWLMRAHEDEKMLTKLSKEENRKAQLYQESRFGVSPSPTKSNLHRVRVTPASIRKTPRPAIGFNSSKGLQHSVIEPTAGPIEGPKTSSPKELAGMLSPRRVFSPAPSTIPPSSPLAMRSRKHEVKTPTRPWKY